MKASTHYFYLLFYIAATLLLFVAASEHQNAEVELLIVCDKEFSERFLHDHQKIIDYWNVYMWDINMKFKTLASVDISFRVTSIITINSTEDQPFIEEARSENGLVSLETAHNNFQSWLYVHEKNISAFDIALLASGARPSGKDELISYGEKNPLCVRFDSEKLMKNCITMSITGAWGNTCSLLEAGFAEMLGAPLAPVNRMCHFPVSECNEDHYVMSDKSCNSGQYFFSTCSDDGIAKILNSSQAFCLWEKAAPGKDILKLSKVTHPPTLDDQCTMMTKNNMSTAFNAPDKCVHVRCLFEEDDLSTFLSMIPLDNSPCDDGKFCFRGRCLPQGRLLRNVASGQCLHSTDKFSLNDQPKMSKCRLLDNNPMDKLMVYEKGSYERFLTTPVLYDDKCLSLDPVEFRYVQYEPCSSGNDKHLSWDFMKVGDDGEFLLLHLYTMTCAKVAKKDGLVELVGNCDENDPKMRWVFEESTVSTLGWFDNYDPFRKPTDCELMSVL